MSPRRSLVPDEIGSERVVILPVMRARVTTYRYSEFDDASISKRYRRGFSGQFESESAAAVGTVEGEKIDGLQLISSGQTREAARDEVP